MNIKDITITSLETITAFDVVTGNYKFTLDELQNATIANTQDSNRTYDGIVFDSILEMKYYRDVLCPLVESGDVVRFELQKPYELQPKFKHDDKNVHPITYVADFFIVYKDGTEVVIDTKGCPDSVANIKRKLFWYKFPDVDYRWVTYSGIDGGWCSYEYVKKQRAIRRKAKREAQKEKMEEENNGKSK